jgi:hypothetical protein
MNSVEQAGRSWVPEPDKDLGMAGNEDSKELASKYTGTGVQLTEWEKEGWTYHAKG